MLHVSAVVDNAAACVRIRSSSILIANGFIDKSFDTSISIPVVVLLAS